MSFFFISDEVTTEGLARFGDVVVLVAGGCVALVAVSRFLPPASFVARVEVENRSEYAVALRVAERSGESWTPLGTAQAKQVTAFEDVYDQGGTWVFEFAHGPFGREVTMSRDDLRRGGWRVTVPDELIAQLRAASTPPTPVFGDEEGEGR